MSGKKRAAQAEKAKTVVANDQGSLKRVGGSQSDQWNSILATNAQP